MGFGILFLSYFLAFFVPLSYLHVLGYAGVAWALGKLKDYRPAFMRAVWWLIPLGVCCLYHVASSVLTLLPSLGVAAPDVPLINKVTTAIVSMVESALILGFHISFLLQLRGFARELELPKIAKRADFGIWLVGVQASSYILALTLELAGAGLQLFSAIAFLLQFVWAVVNLVNLFGCYMYICPEGDEDMARKPSKIGFVNDIRDKMEERDREVRAKDAEMRAKKGEKKRQKSDKKR